jgi:hypothetical protein
MELELSSHTEGRSTRHQKTPKFQNFPNLSGCRVDSRSKFGVRPENRNEPIFCRLLKI